MPIPSYTNWVGLRAGHSRNSQCFSSCSLSKLQFWGYPVLSCLLASNSCHSACWGFIQNVPEWHINISDSVGRSPLYHCIPLLITSKWHQVIDWGLGFYFGDRRMKSAVGSLQYCAPEADKGELPMSRMDSTEMGGFPCFNQNSATLPSGSPGPTGRPLDGWLQIRILLRLRFVPLAAVWAAEGGRIPGSLEVGSLTVEKGTGVAFARIPSSPGGVWVFVPMWCCVASHPSGDVWISSWGWWRRPPKGWCSKSGYPSFSWGTYGKVMAHEVLKHFEWCPPMQCPPMLPGSDWQPCQEKFPMEDEVWQAISPEAKES